MPSWQLAVWWRREKGKNERKREEEADRGLRQMKRFSYNRVVRFAPDLVGFVPEKGWRGGGVDSTHGPAFLIFQVFNPLSTGFMYMYLDLSGIELRDEPYRVLRVKLDRWRVLT